MTGSILHVVASLKASSGGTSRSVPALCEALAAFGSDVSLAAQSARWPASAELVPKASLVHTHLVPGVSIPALRLSYSPGFASELRSICRLRRIEIIHVHGVWVHANHVAARVARELRIPLVVSPRGMLEEWAIAYRGWKKRLAWSLYQEADLTGARACCATSGEEARQLRQLGLRMPVAVIPNGVEIPERPVPTLPRLGIRTVLFLSRIHPKKGVLDLVRAWAALRPLGWRLLIAGPDEDGHANVVRAAVAACGLGGDVEFTGEVGGEVLQQLWGLADLFVLPTRSENFGMVVAEALAREIPVITTRAAPWAELEERRCGWWIEQGPEPLRAALAVAMSLPDAERQAMGERGRRLVEERYAWARVAQETSDFYNWLLGRGDKPGCVLADA